MPQDVIVENRSGPRYMHAFPVRAEWDTSEGVHIVAEGETENVGPEGALIHLQRELPPVGGRVNLLVLDDAGEKLSVIAEVIRIERNPAHPQAALQLLGETDEWRGLVWEEAGVKMSEADDDYDEDDY
jgi:PilZ domain-containing protein